MPPRDWADAREKLEREEQCRVCGATWRLECAHIMGRKHDEPKTPGSKTLYVKPDRIVPLCGPFPEGCHGDFDHRRIDLMIHLTPEEQAQAVLDAGGIELARRKLCPSAFLESPPLSLKPQGATAPGRSQT